MLRDGNWLVFSFFRFVTIWIVHYTTPKFSFFCYLNSLAIPLNTYSLSLDVCRDDDQSVHELIQSNPVTVH
jgi:hypothetical protein